MTSEAALSDDQSNDAADVERAPHEPPLGHETTPAEDRLRFSLARLMMGCTVAAVVFGATQYFPTPQVAMAVGLLTLGWIVVAWWFEALQPTLRFDWWL